MSSHYENFKELAQDFASYCYWKTGDFQDIINCGTNELGQLVFLANGSSDFDDQNSSLEDNLTEIFALGMGLCSSSSRGDCAKDAMGWVHHS